MAVLARRKAIDGAYEVYGRMLDLDDAHIEDAVRTALGAAFDAGASTVDAIERDGKPWTVLDIDRLERERDDYRDRWETLGRVARRMIDQRDDQLRRAVDPMRESRIARARGLAQAISECRDDAPLDGIREGAAEIVTLLGGQ